MKVTKVKKLMISGISITTNNETELSEEGGKIPALWDEYFQKEVFKTTFNKAHDGYMYGVYTNYKSDDTANYDVTVGVEVTKPKKAIVIEDKRYLVFSNKGELPLIVTDTWQEIWDYFDGEPEYERAFTVDFEKYVSEDEIEIYIAIK